MEMTDGICIAILIGVIIYQGLFIFQMKKENEGREKDMMDRIMTRNYETFVQAETVRESANNPQPVFEEERGIPI